MDDRPRPIGLSGATARTIVPLFGSVGPWGQLATVPRRFDFPVAIQRSTHPTPHPSFEPVRLVINARRLRRALNLRQGEGRTFTVIAGFLFLNTANTTLLSAAKNGLFLSVYEPDLIPHAVISAALLTAFVAVVFTGIIAATQRRALASGLTAALSVSVVGSWGLFQIHPRTAFAVYLWLSTVQVLLLTHAWEYAGSMLAGRQAKRMIPMIGVGASLGAIAGGSAVAPAALRFGTSNLLFVSLALLSCALPLLWLVDEPGRETEDPEGERHMLTVFLSSSLRGIKAVGDSRLLRLLALGLVTLTVTGTLIDLQLKFILQETFSRDDITAIYGLMSAAVGAGTLLLQLWASRVLFPRYGVSLAAMLHGGALLLATGGVAILGGLSMLVVAQALDDILQFSLQKPVEQVSLLPFPSQIKSVALATLGGVLRPLSKAAGGGIALAFADQPHVLPLATVACASVAVATYSRHRDRYMRALEGALTRHAIDMSEPMHAPLVVDKSALSVIDRGLRDEDATIVVFSTSLLQELPAEDAFPRVVRLLDHATPEVRAEAASVLGRLDAPLDFAAGVSVANRLAEERVPYVVAALLESVGEVGEIEPGMIERFLDHDEAEVRRAAIVALGRLDWPHTENRITAMLASERPQDRALGSRAVGALGLSRFMPKLAAILSDSEARPAALDALTALGPEAVPTLSEVLRRRALPLALRRTVVTALAGIDSPTAREALLGLVGEPALGPAALHSLSRLRTAEDIPPIDERLLGPVLRDEVKRGLTLSAASTVIRSRAEGPIESFIAGELEGLCERSVRRVLKILTLSYDPDRIETISTGLLIDSPARRTNALEFLEGTVSARSAKLLMPYMDVVADGMPLDRVLELLPDGRRLQSDPAEVLADDPDWWPRSLALHYLGRYEDVVIPGPPKDLNTDEIDMMPLIEKVMILKGSEFFRRFPGADLAGIAALAEVLHVGKDDVIFEQGDEGDAFYMVVQGAVAISRGATKLATLGPREGFGEMAILDREARSATATAAEDTTLLSLDRDSFDRVIEQNPIVARGIYRVLTERLRNTLAQLASN